MQELEHRWTDSHTYKVACPISGTLYPVGILGMSDDEVRVERINEDTIKVINVDCHAILTCRWEDNSWVEKSIDFDFEIK